MQTFARRTAPPREGICEIEAEVTAGSEDQDPRPCDVKRSSPDFHHTNRHRG